mmetsp:Transcript_66841/g.178013  ORF Transcript_66841/g.178013 Transcript_66841/m.178013 type:complete len:459 (-) Transcript_66841:61-1437(-)
MSGDMLRADRALPSVRGQSPEGVVRLLQGPQGRGRQPLPPPHGRGVGPDAGHAGGALRAQAAVDRLRGLRPGPRRAGGRRGVGAALGAGGRGDSVRRSGVRARRPRREGRGRAHGADDPADAVGLRGLRRQRQELQDEAGAGGPGGPHPEGLARQPQDPLPRDGGRAPGRRHRRRGLRGQAAGAQGVQAQGRRPLHRAEHLPGGGALRLRAARGAPRRAEALHQDLAGRDRQAHAAGLRPLRGRRGQDGVGDDRGRGLPRHRQRCAGRHERHRHAEEGLRDPAQAQGHRRGRLRRLGRQGVLQAGHARGDPGGEEDEEGSHDVLGGRPERPQPPAHDEGGEGRGHADLQEPLRPWQPLPSPEHQVPRDSRARYAGGAPQAAAAAAERAQDQGGQPRSRGPHGDRHRPRGLLQCEQGQHAGWRGGLRRRGRGRRRPQWPGRRPVQADVRRSGGARPAAP